MFFRIKTLVQKELRTLLRDPQSARLLIGVVFLQLILFPFAATMEVKNNTLAIFNQDSGARSAELIQRFSKAAAFSEVLYVDSQSDIATAYSGFVDCPVWHAPRLYRLSLARQTPQGRRIHPQVHRRGRMPAPGHQIGQ